MDVCLNSNSLQNNNIKNVSYNMSTARLRNTKYLNTLGRNARGDTESKVNQIIKLYGESKIPHIETAENIIVDLLYNKNKKSVSKKYDKLIEKQKKNEPLNKRLTQKKEIKKKAARTIVKAFKKHFEPKVEFKNLNKAQNQIEFNLNHIKEFDSLNLAELYPKLRKRIYEESRKLLIIKNNIKITIGCNATFMKKIQKQVILLKLLRM